MLTPWALTYSILHWGVAFQNNQFIILNGYVLLSWRDMVKPIKGLQLSYGENGKEICGLFFSN